MANETVLVGCKLPHGLILSLPNESVKLAGSASWINPPKGKKNPPKIMYADSFTSVSKAFWESWVEWAKVMKFEPYLRGHVYSATSEKEAEARAKDGEGIKTGMERLDENALTQLGHQKDKK